MFVHKAKYQTWLRPFVNTVSWKSNNSIAHEFGFIPEAIPHFVLPTYIHGVPFDTNTHATV